MQPKICTLLWEKHKGIWRKRGISKQNVLFQFSINNYMDIILFILEFSTFKCVIKEANHELY